MVGYEGGVNGRTNPITERRIRPLSRHRHWGGGEVMGVGGSDGGGGK